MSIKPAQNNTKKAQGKAREKAYPHVGGAANWLFSVPRKHPLELGLLSTSAARHLQGLHPAESLVVGQARGRGEGPVVLLIAAIGNSLCI